MYYKSKMTIMNEHESINQIKDNGVELRSKSTLKTKRKNRKKLALESEHFFFEKNQGKIQVGNDRYITINSPLIYHYTCFY